MRQAPVYFRAGVGAVILDQRGRVLACERHNIPGAWQMPQGGLELDETPLEAMWREVREETGLRKRDLELVRRCREPLVYELPPEYQTRKTGLGQVQYWFLVRFTGDDRRIDLGDDGEFRAWRWMTFPSLIRAAIAFRRPLYRRIAACFNDHL